MSVNAYQPHVLVLPEDDANRQMANGFVLHAHLKQHNIQILPPSGGWGKVLASFVSEHIAGLRKYPHRHLVLLIDFDDHVDARREHFVAQFPTDVRERVFLLGTRGGCHGSTSVDSVIGCAMHLQVECGGAPSPAKRPHSSRQGHVSCYAFNHIFCG